MTFPPPSPRLKEKNERKKERKKRQKENKKNTAVLHSVIMLK